VFVFIKLHSHPASPLTSVGNVAVTDADVVSTRNVLFMSVETTDQSAVFEDEVGLYHAFDEVGNVALRTALMSLRWSSP